MVRWTSSRERLCLIDRALNMLCMGWPPNTRTIGGHRCVNQPMLLCVVVALVNVSSLRIRHLEVY